MLFLAFAIQFLAFWGQLGILRRFSKWRSHHLIYLWFVVAWLLSLLYFVAWPLGFACSVIFFSGGLFQALFALKKSPRSLRNDELRLGEVLIVGLLYLAWASLKSYSGNFVDHLQHLYFDIANDNVIPRLFAESLRYGRALIFPGGIWQFSDRPPLQSSAYLMLSFYTDTKTYEAAGLLFQLLWIPALRDWLKSLELRASSFQTYAVLFLCGSSGVIFFNSLYVWPKLLSAAFFFWALTDFERGLQNSSETASRMKTAGMGLALALLAHTGIAFAFPMLGWPLFRLWRQRRLDASSLFSAGGIAFLLLLPWFLFTKFYQPPGDALLRLHLAGTPGHHELSFPQLLARQYSQLNTSEIFDVRWKNLLHILWPQSWPSDLRTLRRWEFDHVLGALNLSLIGLGLALCRASLRPWILWSLFTALPWAASFYHPYQTTVVHASFGWLLVVMALGYTGWVLKLSRNALQALLLVKLLLLLVFWNPWIG